MKCDAHGENPGVAGPSSRSGSPSSNPSVMLQHERSGVLGDANKPKLSHPRESESRPPIVVDSISPRGAHLSTLRGHCGAVEVSVDTEVNRSTTSSALRFEEGVVLGSGAIATVPCSVARAGAVGRSLS